MSSISKWLYSIVIVGHSIGILSFSSMIALTYGS